MYYAPDVITGLIDVLSDDELVELSANLENFATKIKTKTVTKLGSFPGKDYSPKALVGKIIKEIELKLLEREKNPNIL